MDEIELKHCPFCGGDAEMQQGKYQGLRTWLGERTRMPHRA